MSINKILVVDDEPLIRGFLKDTFKKTYEVKSAANGEEAIFILQKESFDLIITDLKMPKKTGIEVLSYAKEKYPNIIVIMMSAFGSIESAVYAMQKGAYNYIIKPFSPETIETLIYKANEQLKIIKENQFLRKQAIKPINLIHSSPCMQEIIKDVEKISQSNASIFISGESGTGKEVLANAIYSLSNRNTKPFIKVNCAAINDSLIESEFFGHEKGSFTGADQKKIGRFELADTGTLLLDEISEIPLNLQAKLLRAIQEMEFERVGGTKPVKVNIRFISTSNRNIKQAIEKNSFRQDLFFRLNVIPIHLPSLRERKEDILPLAKYFLDKFCKKNIKSQKIFTNDAEKALENYSWPGNIRELSNVIERAVILDQDNKIKRSDLNIENTENTKTSPRLADMEKILILKTLKKYQNNKTKAAQILGINIKTLRNKLKTYK